MIFLPIWEGESGCVSDGPLATTTGRSRISHIAAVHPPFGGYLYIAFDPKLHARRGTAIHCCT